MSSTDVFDQDIDNPGTSVQPNCLPEDLKPPPPDLHACMAKHKSHSLQLQAGLWPDIGNPSRRPCTVIGMLSRRLF